jgi:hypothetical protein
VQLQAAELVLGLTGSPEGISRLSLRSDKLLSALFRLSAAPTDTSRAALSALVNLSSDINIQSSLISINTVPRSIDYIKEKTCPYSNDLLIMLLANLTSTEQGASQLLGLDRPASAGLNVAFLLNKFVAPCPSNIEHDTYGHVATILPNVTREQAGRQLLLQPGRGLLGALASELRSKSELRRRGCASAIKNVCFSVEQDNTIEEIIQDSGAIDAILDALCGISGSPKQEDDTVREALAEALLCLTMNDVARKVLWSRNAAELLQKGYEYEENRVVCDAMEKMAEYFLQDGFQPEGEEGGGNKQAGGTVIEAIDN